MANPFVHVELTTQDTDKARIFYGALFDWKLEDVEMGPGVTYTLIRVGEGTGGGMMKTSAPGAPTAWLPYVLVDDVAAATAKAKSLGATICKNATEVMGAGSFSIIMDPAGAAIGSGKKRQNDARARSFLGRCGEIHSAALPEGTPRLVALPGGSHNLIHVLLRELELRVALGSPSARRVQQ